MTNYDDVLRDELWRQRARAEAAAALAAEKSSEKNRPLPDLTMKEFVAQEEEPLLWRVEGLCAVGDNTMIIAEKKVGKSTLMLNLLRSLADGVPFLGRPVLKPEGRIAYWNLELGERRFREWCKQVGVHNMDRITIANLRGQLKPIYDDPTAEEIVEWLQRNEIEVWIIDPLSGLLPGWPGANGDTENNNTIAGHVTARLDSIKLSGGVQDLLIPQHSGHTDKGRGRGAAKWGDWPDQLWSLTKKEIIKGEKVRVFSALGRDVEVEECALTYEERTKHVGAELTLKEMSDIAGAKAVVQALRGSPPEGLNVRDLRPLVKGLSTEKRDEAIALAERLGWVTQTQVGRRKVTTLNRAHPDVIEQMFDHPGDNQERL